VSERLEQITEFDERVDKWLEPHRSPLLDRIFFGLSSAADHGLVWHVFGIIRAITTRDIGFVLRFGKALGYESLLTNGVIKQFFGRTRPSEHYENTDPLPYGMRRPITSSFPSGHAATAFMAAFVLSRGKRTAPAWYVLASLVAFSRVYVRLHHASDVIAGAALGLALGPIARRIVGKNR